MYERNKDELTSYFILFKLPQSERRILRTTNLHLAVQDTNLAIELTFD